MEINHDSKIEQNPITSTNSDKYLSKSNLKILEKFEGAVNQTQDIDKKFLLNVASIVFLKNAKGPYIKTNDIDYNKINELLNLDVNELKDYIVSKENQVTHSLLNELIAKKEVIPGKIDNSIAYLANSIKYLTKKYPAPNTRNACDDCLDQCGDYYRYSSIWYNYYYDVYIPCVNNNFLQCNLQATLYAEHMIEVNYCGPACESVCDVPCTDCPPGYNYDGANCFLGKIPQGWQGYIDRNSRKFYLKKKCCQICPPGFQYDNANCLYNFSFNPNVYEPFINTASDGSKHFYVEPDNNGNCPSGTFKDGAGNCYIAAVPSGYSPFIHDDKFYVEPHCYPNGNNCCPSGTYFDGKDCVMGTYPSGWEPFVYDGGFYVIPNCD